MENVQKELNKISNLQQTISSKLDKFDEKYSNNENILKDSLSTDISNNEYKQTLNNRLDLIMGKINDNIINKNYLNFYDFLLNRKKFFEENQKKEFLIETQKLEREKEKIKENISNNDLKNESIQADIHRSQSLKFPTKIQLSYNNGFNQNYNNFSETFDDKNNLYLLTKKQNVFLENELINLKVKINKIRNSNQLLKNLLNKENKCKNPKILEKFIENFIEKLAVNWNEICDLIIDEMLEQEVYELNELELKKIHFDELKLTTFKDVLKNAPNKTNFNNNNIQNNLMFESFYEIQRICNEIRNKEFEIQNKYNINNNNINNNNINNNINNKNKKENKPKKLNKKKNKK